MSKLVLEPLKVFWHQGMDGKKEVRAIFADAPWNSPENHLFRYKKEQLASFEEFLEAKHCEKELFAAETSDGVFIRERDSGAWRQAKPGETVSASRLEEILSVGAPVPICSQLPAPSTEPYSLRWEVNFQADGRIFQGCAGFHLSRLSWQTPDIYLERGAWSPMGVLQMKNAFKAQLLAHHDFLSRAKGSDNPYRYKMALQGAFSLKSLEG